MIWQRNKTENTPIKPKIIIEVIHIDNAKGQQGAEYRVFHSSLFWGKWHRLAAFVSLAASRKRYVKCTFAVERKVPRRGRVYLTSCSLAHSVGVKCTAGTSEDPQGRYMQQCQLLSPQQTYNDFKKGAFIQWSSGAVRTYIGTMLNLVKGMAVNFI